MQRRPAGLVDARAQRQQFAHQIQLALDAGQHQRGLALRIGIVDPQAGRLKAAARATITSSYDLKRHSLPRLTEWVESFGPRA